MFTPSLVLALALLQQPGRDASAARAARLAAFDSTKALLSTVGRPVAEVRSALDVYRRAVFNGTDQEVLANAEYLRSSCQAVETAARLSAPRICRHCTEGNEQAAFDGYRQMLPSLRRGMSQCATRLGQLQKAGQPAKRLREDVRVVGNPLIATLRGYEARLAEVRRALNITAPPPPPPRGSTGR
jgi:hypothetical protein